MTLRIRNLQVDVPAEHHDATVAFWAGALGATSEAAGGPFTHLVGVPGPVGLHLQRLRDGAAGYHLDAESDDPDAEVARLVALGARVVDTADDAPVPVLRDPAGLPFCVCRAGSDPGERLAAPSPGRVWLEHLVIDVPSAVLDATVAFWSAALGATVHPVGRPHDAFTYLADATGVGGELGILVQDVGTAPARLHVDLHVPAPSDRDREVARLESLGAHQAATVRHWVILTDPAGNLLCVVPDVQTDQPEPHA